MLGEIASKKRDQSIQSLASEKNDPTCQVSLLNASAKWSAEITELTLSKVSATVKSGQLLAVVGPVGAGKVRKWVISCSQHKSDYF